jgi:hypothetical protein
MTMAIHSSAAASLYNFSFVVKTTQKHEIGTSCNKYNIRNEIVTLNLQAARYTPVKVSKRFKKGGAMEASRCDQKWTFRLPVGMVMSMF